MTLPIRLSDGVVYERRHRNVLRFVYSNKDASSEAKDRNDFEAKFNPFLAYAARCTSAFPAAFEPMCLCDTDAILKGYLPYANKENCGSDSSDWQRFYKDYLNPVGVNTVKFSKRPFADGGYLDNKPFTYATETVARRQADLLVTRKLIYIEPSPEHPEDEPDSAVKPDAIDNVSAALLSLPRYETIREDLQRVRDHNRLVERVQSILTSVDRDKKIGTPRKTKSFTDDEWSKLDLAQVVTEKGIGYVAYFRLDISSVSDDLAKLVTRVAGFDEESDHFMIIRSLVGEWRAKTYVEHGTGKPSLNQFLFEFNLAYPMRRINFLRTKISELADKDRDNPQAQAKLLAIKKELNQAYKDLRSTARQLRSRQKPKESGVASAEFEPSPAYAAIQKLREALPSKTYARLPEDVRSKTKDPVVEYFLGVHSNGATVTGSSTIKDQCDIRARELLTDPEILPLFDHIATALKNQIRPAKKKADDMCRKALGLQDKASDDEAEPPDAAVESLEYLGYYYQNYDEYDRIIFPIIYGTEIGEAAKVDIVRISPEDATALINERETGWHKLAGSALGHFGAFLDPLWRRNDIMWGRLDGAERIITALLPNDRELARQLVGEAHAAIVHEAIAKAGANEAKDLICEAGMRTRSGSPEPNLMTNFIENLKTYDVAEKVKTLIDDNAFRQHYLDTFPTRSKLDPESTAKTAARATTVIGKMLEGLSSSRNAPPKPAVWLARLGRIFWALVEVAVPRSFPELFFRHWLKLIYFLEALMIVGSTLLLAPGAQRFAITAFGITAAVHLAVVILSDLIQTRNRWVTLAKTIGIVILVIMIGIGGLAISAILGADRLWNAMGRARTWIAVSWDPIMYGLGGFVFLVFLWAIRKDLRSLWRRQVDNPASTNFSPIEIVPPYDVHKNRVRKLTFRNRYLIPFRLSDTPPKAWTRMFRKNWTTKQKAAVVFKESELRLVSKLNDVENIFPGLKDAVARANAEYVKFLEQVQAKNRQAAEAAKARREIELRLKQNISATLEKLNSPSVNQ